jgi:hypothetical protein
VLGVNPFDQPDVEASRRRARSLLARRTQAAAPVPPAGQRRGSLLVDAGDAAAPDGGQRLENALARWLRRPPPAYHALLFYLPGTDATQAWLSRWQQRLRDAAGGAVTAGFGPRYLHSCGQLHKGGPAGGTYLFVRMADRSEEGAGGAREPLAACHAAQAEADLRELRARGRECVSVRLCAGLDEGLLDLSRLLEAALGSEIEFGDQGDVVGETGPDTRGALAWR